MHLCLKIRFSTHKKNTITYSILGLKRLQHVQNICRGIKVGNLSIQENKYEEIVIYMNIHIVQIKAIYSYSKHGNQVNMQIMNKLSNLTIF